MNERMNISGPVEKCFSMLEWADTDINWSIGIRFLEGMKSNFKKLSEAQCCGKALIETAFSKCCESSEIKLDS